MKAKTKERKRNRKLRVTLSKKDRSRLQNMLSRGEGQVRVFKRARALQLLDEGKRAPAVGAAIGLDDETVRCIGWAYVEDGLKRAIYEDPRPGAKAILNGRKECQMVAMICSDPPLGHERWTVSLIVAEAKRRQIVPTIGETTVRKLLKNHSLKPWLKKNVVHSKSHQDIYHANGGRARPIREAA